jgi:carbonic anhydrase/acetyltransferase-like protein (isoleucine patch superfamily)
MIGENCYIDRSAVIVGDVEIGADCSVWPNAAIRGDQAPIRIGMGSNIQDCAVIHVGKGEPCLIGENVTVGHCAVVHSAEIGDNCLIGIHATVLGGSSIGKGSIIGANALVTSGSKIPPKSMVLGVPGKVVRTDDNFLNEASKNAYEYRKLKDLYRQGSFKRHTNYF